jgi:hypothetical protein
MANPNPNQKGLKPPRKGEIRNPKGKAKGIQNASTIARRWAETEQTTKNPLTGADERLTQADLMTLAQIKNARGGDLSAYREIMDRAYGKVADRAEVSIDTTAQTEKDELKGMTRAELRAYAKETYGLNPDTLFAK